LRGVGLLTDGEAAPSVQPSGRKRVGGDLFYLRFKIFDPDRLFDWLIPKIQFLFTPYFVALSAALVVGAAGVSVVNWSEIIHQSGALFRFESLCAGGDGNLSDQMVFQYEPIDQARRLLPAERLARRTQPEEEGVRSCRRPDQKVVRRCQRTFCGDHAARTANLLDLRPPGRRLFILASGPDSDMVRRIYGQEVSRLGFRSFRRHTGVHLSPANQEITLADYHAVTVMVEQGSRPAQTGNMGLWLRCV